MVVLRRRSSSPVQAQLFLEESGGHYTILVSHNKNEWKIMQSYSGFRKLRKQMLKVRPCMGCHRSEAFHAFIKDDFPSKQLFAMPSKLASERRAPLERFVLETLDIATACSQKRTCELVQLVFEFYHLGDTTDYR